MLMPKRVKYRKVQRGRMTGAASRGNKVSYGEFGIQALEPGWITGNQIEAARIAMTRYTKRGGKVWIKIFTDKPYSKKGLGTRMGSGKGAPEGWVAVVKNQKVMFEIGGVSEEVAREALRLAQHKLPIKTKIITKEVDMTVFIISGDRPIDGSSSMRSLGRLIIARPMASICCSPPENVPAAWFLRSPRIGNRS